MRSNFDKSPKFQVGKKNNEIFYETQPFSMVNAYQTYKRSKLLITMVTLGKPIMMFRVNLINYLMKLHLKCINEYCIRISEILCILKCVVMIDMKTRHILFR